MDGRTIILLVINCSTLINVLNSPLQAYPEGQLQEYDPAALAHNSALGPNPPFGVHSSISNDAQKKPCML